VITLVRDDRAKLRETFASRLRNEAELGKVGSERVDQLGALTDQKIPRSMQHEQGLLIGDLIGTNRIDGRVTASQMAAASAASLFDRLTQPSRSSAA
jgi:hypothetical protein